MAVSDMDICRKITPQFLSSRLSVLNHAQLIVADANPGGIPPLSGEKLYPAAVCGPGVYRQGGKAETGFRKDSHPEAQPDGSASCSPAWKFGTRPVWRKPPGRCWTRACAGCLFLGKDGGVFAADHRQSLLLPGRPAEAVNATGAGDAFMAGLAWAYLEDGFAGHRSAGTCAGAIAIEGAETINPALSAGTLEYKCCSRPTAPPAAAFQLSYI